MIGFVHGDDDQPASMIWLETYLEDVLFWRMQVQLNNKEMNYDDCLLEIADKIKISVSSHQASQIIRKVRKRIYSLNPQPTRQIEFELEKILYRAYLYGDDPNSIHVFHRNSNKLKGQSWAWYRTYSVSMHHWLDLDRTGRRCRAENKSVTDPVGQHLQNNFPF